MAVRAAGLVMVAAAGWLADTDRVVGAVIAGVIGAVFILGPIGPTKPPADRPE
jgi:hypothetical protein